LLLDLAVSVLVILAGSLGMLLLLLLWFGDRTIAVDLDSDLDPILGERDRAAIYESHSPFIPMPKHLRTNDEMVAWMTKELPKLTADMESPRS